MMQHIQGILRYQLEMSSLNVLVDFQFVNLGFTL